MKRTIHTIKFSQYIYQMISDLIRFLNGFSGICRVAHSGNSADAYFYVDC